MIAAAPESFQAALEELKPLLPIHYAELALDQDEAPLDPRYDVYFSAENADGLVFVTLRDDGALIGYFIGFVAPGLHYASTLTCNGDIFYVHPDHRGKAGGALLFTETEAELRRRGVKRWYVGLKHHMAEHAERLFSSFGMKPADVYFSKILEG